MTTGLLAIMNRDELEGVLAHELSHIHNYDILVGTIAVTLVGFVALLADFGLRLLLFGGIGGRRRDSRDAGQVYLLALSVVFIVLAPIAAKAMQLAISRRREALADVSGVLITRNPAGLIAALEKLRDRPPSSPMPRPPRPTSGSSRRSTIGPRAHTAGSTGCSRRTRRSSSGSPPCGRSRAPGLPLLPSA